MSQPSPEISTLIAFDAFLQQYDTHQSFASTVVAFRDVYTLHPEIDLGNLTRHPRNTMLVRVLAMQPPLECVEKLVASSMTWSPEMHITYNSLAKLCVRHNRAMFLAAMIDRGKLDVDLDFGSLARNAVLENSLDVLRVLLERQCDVESSYKFVETTLYEGTECNVECRHHTVTRVHHSIRNGTRDEAEAAIARIRDVIGNVHIHGVFITSNRSPLSLAEERNWTACNMIQEYRRLRVAPLNN